ncbi:MAG: chemotaxis protein CheW [Cyanobacteria bacterium J06621_11]
MKEVLKLGLNSLSEHDDLSDHDLSEHDLSGQAVCALSESSSSRLLQRLSPLDYREAQTAQLAAPLPNTRSSERMAVLIFRLCQEWFALPASLCRQVLAPIPAHTLPHRSNSTLIGVVNVSGQMLLKVSLFALLGGLSDVPIESSQSGKEIAQSKRSGEAALSSRLEAYARMVVLEKAGAEGSTEVWVFEVDELEGIGAVALDCLELPAAVPVNSAQVSSTYTRRIFLWQGIPVNLLDDDRLFEALRQHAL